MAGQVMACTATEPTRNCDKKGDRVPADGWYWVAFHTCPCCAGPEVVHITGGFVKHDGHVYAWAEFNGHLASEAIMPPTAPEAAPVPAKVPTPKCSRWPNRAVLKLQSDGRHEHGQQDGESWQFPCGAPMTAATQGLVERRRERKSFRIEPVLV